MTGHLVRILDGKYCVHVTLPRSESFDDVAVRGGVTVHDFIVIR